MEKRTLKRKKTKNGQNNNTKATNERLKRIHRGGRRPKAAAFLCVGRLAAALLLNRLFIAFLLLFCSLFAFFLLFYCSFFSPLFQIAYFLLFFCFFSITANRSFFAFFSLIGFFRENGLILSLRSSQHLHVHWDRNAVYQFLYRGICWRHRCGSEVSAWRHFRRFV